MESDRKSYLIDKFEQIIKKWVRKIERNGFEWTSWFWIIAAIKCNGKKIIHNIKQSK